ncbi:MAG: amidohydrolase family protein [Dehalococcoidia bacterium]|nr:amidohydrolase family protein [Dehalococcoidia bacterium]
MLVDSHMHVNFNGFALNDIIKYLDTNRIDCCWLLTWEEVQPGKWPYQHLPVEEVFDAYSKHPDRIVPMYAPDPTMDDAAAKLESWHQRGIRGCGELKTTLNWDSPRLRGLLAAAAKLGVPVVFHMEEARSILTPQSTAIRDRLVCAAARLATRTHLFKSRLERLTFPGYLLDFASLERALNDFPELNFIGHGLMFWKYISADAPQRRESLPTGPVTGEGLIWRLFREHPNLYADISGDSGFNALARDPANAKVFLSTFADRILYGTDNVMAGQRQFLDSLGLAPRTYSRLYGENACSLVRVPPRGAPP